MAVGTNRHYTVHTILGRHFEQTAERCGLRSSTIDAIIEEIADTGKARIDAVVAGLPAGFPGKVANSIADGARRRINSLARTASATSTARS